MHDREKGKKNGRMKREGERTLELKIERGWKHRLKYNKIKRKRERTRD